MIGYYDDYPFDSSDYYSDFWDDDDYELPEPQPLNPCERCVFRATCKPDTLYYCSDRDLV